MSASSIEKFTTTWKEDDEVGIRVLTIDHSEVGDRQVQPDVVYMPLWHIPRVIKELQKILESAFSRRPGRGAGADRATTGGTGGYACITTTSLIVMPLAGYGS